MTPIDYIRAIVLRHRYRQSLTNPYRDDLGGLKWPAIYKSPSGKEILFDSDIIKSIHDLSSHLERDNRSVGNDDWIRLIGDCVARALDIYANVPDEEELCSKILKYISDFIAKSRENYEFEFAFGCDLLNGYTPNPFHIGPVCFEARHAWLDRKVAEGAISGTTERRIRRVWNGGKIRKRRCSTDDPSEKAILCAIDDAPFVCSVYTRGMAHSFARQRALTTARLALTSVALLWQRASPALSKMNLIEDRVCRIVHGITFREKKIVSWGGWKSHANGEYLNEAEWNRLLQQFPSHFKSVGDTLNTIADVTTPPQRSEETQILAHAIFWFHQGCRETEDAIAIVNFASTLDCLTSDDGQKGIKNLVKEQLGIDPNEPLWIGGTQTANEAIQEIYDDVRNATLHGRINHKSGKPDSMPFCDWSTTRIRAETLAQYCLMAHINKAAQ